MQKASGCVCDRGDEHLAVAASVEQSNGGVPDARQRTGFQRCIAGKGRIPRSAAAFMLCEANPRVEGDRLPGGDARDLRHCFVHPALCVKFDVHGGGAFLWLFGSRREAHFLLTRSGARL